jgi:hypothetical protein
MISDYIFGIADRGFTREVIQAIADLFHCQNIQVDRKKIRKNSPISEEFDTVEMENADVRCYVQSTDLGGKGLFTIHGHIRRESAEQAFRILRTDQPNVIYFGNFSDIAAYQKDPTVRRLLGVVEKPNDPDPAAGYQVENSLHSLIAAELVIVPKPCRSLFETDIDKHSEFIIDDTEEWTIFRIYNPNDSLSRIRTSQRRFRELFGF